MEKALLPLLPLIAEKASDAERQRKVAVRVTLGILGVGTVVAVIYVLRKRSRALAEIAKISTNEDVATAALFVEAVKPPGLLMKILGLSPAGMLVRGVDKVAEWVTGSDTQRCLLLADRVIYIKQVSESYAAFTGGRSLLRDVQKKLGGDYPKFLERLAKNTRATDLENRTHHATETTQAESNKLRQRIMDKPAGKAYKVAAGSVLIDAPVAAKVATWLYQEPSHKRVVKVDPDKYVGRCTGHFMNYQNKLALVQIQTSTGRFWAEWNDLKRY